MLTSKQRTAARAIASASAAATVLLAFGCGATTDSDDAQAPPPPVSSVPAIPSSPSSSAVPTTSDPPTTERKPAAEGPAQCVAADLSLSLNGTDAAAGTQHKNLTFTNSGSEPCTMVGLPGVSFVTGDSGKQVGEAAFREGTKGAPVTLPVGGTATAPLGFTQVNNFDQKQCKKTEVRGLRVYPPHDTASMFLANPGFGCAGNVARFGHQLTVRTVR